MRIDKKAQKYVDMFTTIKKGDTDIIILKNKHSNDLRFAIYKIHGDLLSNDWIYSTFYSLLEKITEYDIKDIDQLENFRHEIVDSQVDIYTHDQKQWLIDYPKADDFMSEAVSSRLYSTDDGVWQVYAYAQYLAIDEIMQEVINLLSK